MYYEISIQNQMELLHLNKEPDADQGKCIESVRICVFLFCH